MAVDVDKRAVRAAERHALEVERFTCKNACVEFPPPLGARQHREPVAPDKLLDGQSQRARRRFVRKAHRHVRRKNDNGGGELTHGGVDLREIADIDERERHIARDSGDGEPAHHHACEEDAPVPAVTERGPALRLASGNDLLERVLQLAAQRFATDEKRLLAQGVGSRVSREIREGAIAEDDRGFVRLDPDDGEPVAAFFERCCEQRPSGLSSVLDALRIEQFAGSAHGDLRDSPASTLKDDIGETLNAPGSSH